MAPHSSTLAWEIPWSLVGYVCVYMYMYVCIHIYICTHTHVCIHTYVYLSFSQVPDTELLKLLDFEKELITSGQCLNQSCLHNERRHHQAGTASRLSVLVLQGRCALRTWGPVQSCASTTALPPFDSQVAAFIINHHQ